MRLGFPADASGDCGCNERADSPVDEFDTPTSGTPLADLTGPDLLDVLARSEPLSLQPNPGVVGVRPRDGVPEFLAVSPAGS